MADRFFKDLEKPKYAHLVRPGGGLSGEIFDLRDDISDAFGRVDSGCAAQTEGETHIYCHAQDGDDANDGTSLANAVQTLQRAFDLVPAVVQHQTAIHLRGTFENFGGTTLAKFSPSLDFSNIHIDGGDEVAVVAGPWTADTSSVSSIGLSTLGLTPDEHAGYWIEILDGPQAGVLMTAMEHDATTFIPAIDFSSDPGNAQFRIVKPATTLKSDTVQSWIRFGCRGSGFCRFQRIMLEGNSNMCIWPQNNFMVSAVVSDTVNGTFFVSLGQYAYTSYPWCHEVTPGNVGTVNFVNSRGLSLRNSSASIEYSAFAYTSSLYCAKKLELNGIPKGSFSSSRAKDLTLKSVKNYDIRKSNGQYPTKIDGSSGIGVEISQGSDVIIRDDIEISDCGSHAIRAGGHSHVKLQRVIGTGNNGAGLHICSQASAYIDDGDPPTVTGTVGDCTLDGTNGVDLGSGISDFWTDVDGGAAIDKDLAANKEMCLVKEE